MGETKVDVLERILNCGEGMRDVHEAVAELIATNQRTVTAFESLGKASGVVATARARVECESALVVQKAALARIGAA